MTHIEVILGLYYGNIGIMENEMETTIPLVDPCFLDPSLLRHWGIGSVFIWTPKVPHSASRPHDLNRKSLHGRVPLLNTKVVSIFFSIIPI